MMYSLAEERLQSLKNNIGGNLFIASHSTEDIVPSSVHGRDLRC